MINVLNFDLSPFVALPAGSLQIRAGTLIERPRMGFAVPVDSWLRGPLCDWAEALLSESRSRDEGFFHPGPISLKWAEDLAHHRDWQYFLWDG